MLLLAVDLYGIRPFKQPTRISLKPTLNIVTGPNGAGKSAIYHTLSALLFNTPTKKLTFFENHPAQGAVIFQVRDGGIYRIAADFLKGIFNLSKLDASGKGTVLEREQAKIAAWLEKEMNGLGKEGLLSLFLIDRSRLPSLQNGNHPSSPAGPSSLQGASNRHNAADDSPGTPGEKEAQLKELQKRLEQVSHYEQESFTIRDKASEIKRRIEQLSDLDLQMKQMEEAEERKFSHLAGLEKTSPDLFKRYEEGLQNKQTEAGQLEEEKADVESQMSFIGEIDFMKDFHLRLGAGLMALSFLLGFFVTLHGPFRYIFLIGIVGGLALAARAYLRVNRQLSRKEQLGKRRIVLNEKIHQLDRKFDKEHKEALDLIKKAGSKDVQELKAMLRSYQNLLRSKQENRSQKETLLKGDSIENLKEQHHELEKQAGALEEKLRESEGLTQEIYRLQEEVRHASKAAPSSLSIEDSFIGLSASPAETSPTAAPTLISQALAVAKRRGVSFQIDQIQKQANVIYSLFPLAKKEEIRLNDAGETKMGEVGIDRLSSGTADQIFLSVALSVWNQLADIAFPILLDDPFINFDVKRQEVALELLRGVSKKRQVLFFTFASLPPHQGDHRIELAALK